MSVNYLKLPLEDVIRAPVLKCSLSAGSRREEGNISPAPDPPPPRSISATADLCINRVTSCLELTGPSDDITRASNFRAHPLSLSLSHANWHTHTHTHSQLGSLQLVPMVIIISRHPSVYLWTAWGHMAQAVCNWLYIHVPLIQAPVCSLSSLQAIRCVWTLPVNI